MKTFRTPRTMTLLDIVRGVAFLCVLGGAFDSGFLSASQVSANDDFFTCYAAKTQAETIVYDNSDESVFMLFSKESASAETILGQRLFRPRRISFPEFLFPDDLFQGPFKRTRLRTWLRGFGNWSEIDDSDGYANLKVQSYGLSFGIDQQFGRYFLFGAAVGGNETTAKESSRTLLRFSSFHGSLYFRTTIHRLFFDLESGLGYNDSSRYSKENWQWHINAETGTWWEHGLGKAEPYIGIRHVGLDQSPGSESKTTFLAGLRYSWKAMGTLSVNSPRLYVGVLHELGDRNLFNTASFVGAPTVFSVSGYKIPETRLFFGGGFTSNMGTSLDLYVRYTVEMASKYSSHTILLGMNWNY